MGIIYKSGAYTVLNDRVIQGEFEAIAVSSTAITSNYEHPDAKWELSKDISAFPQYKSSYPLMDALYNLSLEEMLNAVEADNTFRTGKEWAGVWTRDISYSIILSMALLQPEVAKISLMKKVKNDRIIQDTGTGGSYPVSSDRMIWAVAAWEVYKTTGDKDWLNTIYLIILNSITDDVKNIYDQKTGLVLGESSFLDWREQTYPEWMQPADIFASYNLGTNAVHYAANLVLVEIAGILKDAKIIKTHTQLANKIKMGINKYLWMPAKGYYGQYLYGRHHQVLSPRAEALGEALTILFDIADVNIQPKIVAATPVNEFGIPSIYPQIPDVPPYHNNAVWPFVQSYWALAAAKTGNEQSLIQSMSSIYRASALFLTNKENFVASTGDFAGTQINSSNMLWSLAGNLSLIYKVVFGINILKNGLMFKPLVPKALKGKRTLNKFKYQNAILDINMSGYGDVIKSITLNGKPLKNATIPSNISGNHTINIILSSQDISKSKSALIKNCYSPATPKVQQNDFQLYWGTIPEAIEYHILKDGKVTDKTTSNSYLAAKSGEYQVTAINENGIPSFASEPINVYQPEDVLIIPINIMAIKDKYNPITLNITLPESGLYAIDINYANGHGPISTENKCAIRSFKVNGSFSGIFVFPQRGTNDWGNYGFSNVNQIKLPKGPHQFQLSFEDWNENMNGDINEAMLQYLRLIKIV